VYTVAYKRGKLEILFPPLSKGRVRVGFFYSASVTVDLNYTCLR
jgi:hypothetical protein